MPVSLFVRTFENKTVTVEIPDTEITVQQLKVAIHAKTGVPADQIDLSFAGKILSPDTKSIADFNVQKSNTVQMIQRLPVVPKSPTCSLSHLWRSFRPRDDPHTPHRGMPPPERTHAAVNGGGRPRARRGNTFFTFCSLLWHRAVISDQYGLSFKSLVAGSQMKLRHKRPASSQLYPLGLSRFFLVTSPPGQTHVFD
jgi:hypothetical protein